MFQTVVFLFVIFHLIVSGKFNDFSAIENDNKISVIFFFAKTATSEVYTQDEGIKFLKFVEKKRVKHSVRQSTNDAETLAEYSSTGSDCKQLLKVSIFALISYCRNVLGMTTAIASLENDTFSNGLRSKKSSLEDFEIRYHNGRNKRVNHLGKKPRFITKPEHSEVFKIRSKRQSHVEDDSKEPQPPPGFNLLGILTGTIKMTFFGKLLEEEKEIAQTPQEIILPPVHTQVIEESGRVFQNTLFELVKESLINLQDAHSGFLMVVIGGFLREIDNPYSDLIQSIKHTVETTDEKKTLIIVTGSCPLIDKELTETEDFSIPVYTKGPSNYIDDIIFSGQLYDVPYAVKTVLGVVNAAGNDFGGVQTGRKKRNINESSKIFPSLLLGASSIILYLLF